MTDARYRFERGVDPAFVLPGLDLATAHDPEAVRRQAVARRRSPASRPTPRRVIAFRFRPGREARRTRSCEDAEIRAHPREARLCADRRQGRDPSRSRCRPGVPTCTAPPTSWKRSYASPASTACRDADAACRRRRAPGADRAPAPRAPRAARCWPRAGSSRPSPGRSFRASAAEAFGGGAGCARARQSDLDGNVVDAAEPAAGPADRGQAQPQPRLRRCRAVRAGPGLSRRRAGGSVHRRRGVRAGTRQALGLRPPLGRRGAPRSTCSTPRPTSLALLAALGFDAGQGADHARRAGLVSIRAARAALRLGPKIVLAHFGELHPADAEGARCRRRRSSASRSSSTPLPPEKAKGRARRRSTAADLLPVRRDFAFVLDAGVAAGDVVRAAQSADKELISAARVFDLFEGGALGAGQEVAGASR